MSGQLAGLAAALQYLSEAPDKERDRQFKEQQQKMQLAQMALQQRLGEQQIATSRANNDQQQFNQSERALDQWPTDEPMDARMASQIHPLLQSFLQPQLTAPGRQLPGAGMPTAPRGSLTSTPLLPNAPDLGPGNPLDSLAMPQEPTGRTIVTPFKSAKAEDALALQRVKGEQQLQQRRLILQAQQGIQEQRAQLQERIARMNIAQRNSALGQRLQQDDERLAVQEQQFAVKLASDQFIWSSYRAPALANSNATAAANATTRALAKPQYDDQGQRIPPPANPQKPIGGGVAPTYTPIMPKPGGGAKPPQEGNTMPYLDDQGKRVTPTALLTYMGGKWIRTQQ
jgi:hypothetical protein